MNKIRLNNFVLGKSYLQGGYNIPSIKKYLIEKGNFTKKEVQVSRSKLETIVKEFETKKNETKKNETKKSKNKKQVTPKLKEIFSKISKNSSSEVIKFLPAEDVLYMVKKGKITLTDLQWYNKLNELNDYIRDLYLPKRNYYLSEAKKFSGKPEDFFVKIYTDLGGVLSYSYPLIKSFGKMVIRLTIKGDLDLIIHFFTYLDKINKPKHRIFINFKYVSTKRILFSSIKNNKIRIFKWAYSQLDDVRKKYLHNSLLHCSKTLNLPIFNFLNGEENKNIEIKLPKKKNIKNKKVFIAALEGDFSNVKKLVKKEKDVYTALKGAARRNNLEIILWLLKYGVERNTAIKEAAQGGYFDTVKILVENSNDVKEALEGASFGGHLDIIMWCLERGGSKDIAIFEVSKGGHFDVFKILVQRGASINLALIGASEGGNSRIIKWCVNHGASGITEAFNIVQKKMYIEIAKWLSFQRFQKEFRPWVNDPG